MARPPTQKAQAKAELERKKRDALERGHLRDQPAPLGRLAPSEALGRLPPMDLIK